MSAPVTSIYSPDAAAPACDGSARTLYMIGRPTLKDFIRFVEAEALNVPDRATLAQQWHAAAEVARELEEEESGAADGPTITKLG